jgi:hypothetical protein
MIHEPVEVSRRPNPSPGVAAGPEKVDFFPGRGKRRFIELK